MIDFKGKSVIITGSARGIGKGTAIKFGSLGANVVVADLNADAVNATVAELTAMGYKAFGVPTDVSNSESAHALIDACKKEFGTVDVLVNNAGITKDGLLLKMKQTDWDAVIGVNLTGTFNCTHAAVKVMFAQKSGAIINISSISGINGNVGQTNYSASKAGVIGFTKACALELGSRNIRVNAVAPGFTKTEMTDAIPEKIREAQINAIPLKKIGLPEDIANAIAFLASDAASFISGQVLEVNGGGFMPGH